MSKKTKKKAAPRTQAGKVDSGKPATRMQSSPEPGVRPSLIATRDSMQYSDMEKRYQYVKEDLFAIAVISIPLLLILIIASIFIKV